MLRIAVVAGEASGDSLGAMLLRDIKKRYGKISVEGVGGEKMQQEGCVSLFPMERLSIMGIAEVLSSLPALLKLRRRLTRHFNSNPPDLFIGIDAPDFNLTLERTLKRNGIPVIHYVSPSIWAWRSYRGRTIARSVDMIMCLFPFELEIYRQNNITARFVGHPLAQTIALNPDKAAARERLGLDTESTILGIFPGSREREIRTLLPAFLRTARLCEDKQAGIKFISSLRDDRAIQQCREIHEKEAPDIDLEIYRDRAHDVLEASDVVLLKSGTITLEAMLFKKPMVVAYRLNTFTYWLVKLLAHVNHASLPNLLAKREIVPECLQHDCNPELMTEHIQKWLDNEDAICALEEEFKLIHLLLRGETADAAVTALAELLENRQKSIGD